MTCIVGFLDKKTNIAYIGADSLGSNLYHKSIYKNKKVFKEDGTPSICYGMSGSYRAMNILKYNAIFHPDDISMLDAGLKNLEMPYIVNTFIPTVIGVLADTGFTSLDNPIVPDFVMAIKDKLYKIQSDASVLEPADNYIAAGSGESYALASLASTEGEKTLDRIIKALNAAEHNSPSVQKPFYIINTKNDEIIKIEE